MPFEKALFQPELVDDMHAAFLMVCARLRVRPGSSKACASLPLRGRNRH
jgi:hypothetical protein